MTYTEIVMGLRDRLLAERLPHALAIGAVLGISLGLWGMIWLLTWAVGAHAGGLPASAFCLDPKDDPVVGWDGLGAGGFACAGRPMSRTMPMARLWLITGHDPEPYFTVTLDLASSGIVPPKPADPKKLEHGYCIAGANWTMPAYAEGYPIPEPPKMWLYQSEDDNIAGTVTIRGEPEKPLMPNSNYGLIVICPARDP